MELTKEQLGEIGKQVSKGNLLEEVLSNKFSDTRIAIIRGYDNFSYEAYTKGAFFDEAQAKEVMNNILPNGTLDLSDSYHIITGTIKDLSEGEILDRRTWQPLDNIDKRMVYDSLRERLH